MLFAAAGTALLVLVVVTSVRAARRRLSYGRWHLVHQVPPAVAQPAACGPDRGDDDQHQKGGPGRREQHVLLRRRDRPELAEGTRPSGPRVADGDQRDVGEQRRE